MAVAVHLGGRDWAVGAHGGFAWRHVGASPPEALWLRARRLGWRSDGAARTFAFEDARDAVTMLARPHTSGKLALLVDA